MITVQDIHRRNLANLEFYMKEMEKLLQLSDRPEFRQKIKEKIRKAEARRIELQGKVVSQ